MRMVLRKQAAILASFFETHIDNFKCHVLRAIIPHEGGGLHVAKPKLQLKLHVSSGREMTADRGDAAGKACRLNLQAAAILEIRAHGGHRLVKPYASMAALANKFRVGSQFKRRQSQIRAVDSTLDHKFARPDRFEEHDGLK